MQAKISSKLDYRVSKFCFGIGVEIDAINDDATIAAKQWLYMAVYCGATSVWLAW